jgi:hypothetical protein
MGGFFTRERFGEPQFVAGLLLLIFLAQCVWLASKNLHRSMQDDPDELFRIQEGLRRWHGEKVPFALHAIGSPLSSSDTDAPMIADESRYHSALYYLIASAPLLVWSGPLSSQSRPHWGWLARAPYLFLAVMLGASLWYVSRRLYGNAGGYIALMLYCFAPGVISNAALWQTEPETGAAWGAFGAVFTAIAVAHTLYAPREVVLWNWRRILLLGLSLALAIGCQFSLLIALPIALGFMLYLAPTRKGAAVAIWAAACVIGALLLFASYGFRGGDFLDGMRSAKFGVTSQAFAMSGAYQRVAALIAQMSPTLVLAFPVAILVFALWPRTRYFGNTAPLLVAAVFLVMAVGTPHYPGLGFEFVALPFVFVFVAGVFTDLLETRWRTLVMACIWGLLGANAMWNLLQLARIRA